MLKTYLYLPEELNKKVETAAQRQKKSKAEVLRQSIEKGLEAPDEYNGAQILLDISQKAQQILKDEKLPNDLSANHDYYLWGGKKINLKSKP